jgi:pentatricopeptide repeat protein
VTQQSNWSSQRPAGAFRHRHNHGSPRKGTKCLADLLLLSRKSTGRRCPGPVLLAFSSLEVDVLNRKKDYRRGQTSELKREFQISCLGSQKAWTAGVEFSKGDKLGPEFQAVTEDGKVVNTQQIVLQLRRPPSAPLIGIQPENVGSNQRGAPNLHTVPKAHNSRRIYRERTEGFQSGEHPIIEIQAESIESNQHGLPNPHTVSKARNPRRIHRKTAGFQRGEHLIRESRPISRNGLKQCAPLVDEVIAALQQRVRKTRDMNAVMQDYHSISKTDISNVLTEFQLRRDWRGAVQFFKWMKMQAWYVPNARQYTQLIGFLGREGKVDLACSHFQEMLLQKCKPDQYTFTAMVNAYGKAKMYNEALAVFTYMKTARDVNCKPTTVTCNSLVDGLVKGGKYDLAFKLFIDMKEGRDGLDSQCQPNAITYNILIDALCKIGHLEAAVQVFYKMSEGGEEHKVEPNVSTYNTLINACGKSGLYDRAEELLEHMTQHGHEPDRITYTALIDAYGKAGKWESAENMFMGMKSSHIQVDVMAYTAMIDAYASEGLHEKAESLFQMMRESGLRPNQITYLALIEAYGKSGLPLAAQEVFISLEREGYQANVLHYSSLISAYGKVSLYAEAADVYTKMKSSGCQPNPVTLSAVLAAMTKSTSWDDAKVLLGCFQYGESELELALHNLLTADEDLWEPALQTLDKIRESKQLRQSLYNAVLDFMWRFEMKARAAKVVTLANQHGIYTDQYFREEWCLDLHGLSVGGAMVAILKWLNDLHVAWLWGEDVPARLRIITGKGKHSKAKTSALKDPAENLLRQLQAPFISKDEDYGGFLVASGESVRSWCSKPGVVHKLQLTE